MSTSTLDNNLAIIQLRWPSLHQRLITAEHDSLVVSTEENTLVINEIQLTSNYDRVAEANLQLSRIDESSTKVFLYGPALGDTIELLLQREAIEKIHVIVLNLAVFLHVLNSLDHKKWLSDKRIELHDATEINEVYTPFIANPAELILTDESHVALKDKLVIELNNDFIDNLFNTCTASPLKNKSFVINDKDILDLKKLLSNTTLDNIFVAAAGPTLETHLDWLAKEKPFIIAVDAALKTLTSKGIIPNIVVSIDKEVIQLFQNIPPNIFQKTSLVYFPNVDSKLLEYWPGKRYCSYSKTPMYSHFDELKTKSSLFSSGSVVHPAIDLARILGAKNIVLLGADFSFVNNQTHAAHDDLTKASLIVEKTKHWVINGFGEKISTIPCFIGYLRDLERYITKHPEVNFYSGSLLGAKIEGTELWKK